MLLTKKDFDFKISVLALGLVECQVVDYGIGGMDMIKPLYDRLLLETIQEESMTLSGIILPESKDKPTIARVVAIGDLEDNESGNQIQVGDHVIYKKYSATELKHNGQDYLIIELKDILALVEEDK